MVDIFFSGFVDFADGFLGGGVDGLESLAILTFDELVVDEATITGSACGLGRLVGLGWGGARYHRMRCGVKSMADQSRRCHQCTQCFEVERLRISEILTVQWVARICLLQGFLESLKETC